MPPTAVVKRQPREAMCDDGPSIIALHRLSFYAPPGHVGCCWFSCSGRAVERRSIGRTAWFEEVTSEEVSRPARRRGLEIYFRVHGAPERSERSEQRVSLILTSVASEGNLSSSLAIPWTDCDSMRQGHHARPQRTFVAPKCRGQRCETSGRGTSPQFTRVHGCRHHLPSSPESLVTTSIPVDHIEQTGSPRWSCRRIPDRGPPSPPSRRHLPITTGCKRRRRL